MSCFLTAADHDGSLCLEKDLRVVVAVEGVDLGAAIVLTAGAGEWGGDDGEGTEHMQSFMMDMDADDEPTRVLALPYLRMRRPDEFCYFTVRFCGDVTFGSVALPARAQVQVEDEVQYARLLARVTTAPERSVGRAGVVDLVGVAQVCGVDGQEVRAVFVKVEDSCA